VPSDFLELIDKNQKIIVAEVVSEAPASMAGIEAGDIILKKQKDMTFSGTGEFIQYVNSKRGQEISIDVERNGNIFNFKLIPRIETPENQGPLGISFDNSLKKFSWHESLWKGFLAVINLILLMFSTLVMFIKSLFIGKKLALEVAGPVGIAVMTRQAAEAGWVSLILFSSFLSINLGVINILPIPALDGGRILFILIEKIKGSPVSQKTEQMFHTIGFILLIILMVLVTFKDVAKFIK
jgi:regulator of sigma E protease